MSFPKGWTIRQSSGVCAFCGGTGSSPVEHVAVSPEGERFPLAGETGLTRRREAESIAREQERLRYECDTCGARTAEWTDGWRWFGREDEPPEHVLCRACPDQPVLRAKASP